MAFYLVIRYFAGEHSVLWISWIGFQYLKSQHFLTWFSDFMMKFSKFSSSAVQLCFGPKTEFFISILVTQSHTLPPRRRTTCLNFAPFWGSLRESTCRYPTLPTTPLEKVVKHSIIQVGTQYRLAKLLRKLPALLLYSFLVLGNGKSFIFKLFS